MFNFTNFCLILQIYIFCFHPKVVNGNTQFYNTKRSGIHHTKIVPQIKPTLNAPRRFDAAKEAMKLITRVDLPTCRCVNIATGKYDEVY